MPILLSLFAVAAATAQEKKPLTFADLMRFRTIQGPVIADDGSWIAYALKPDRGDAVVVARATEGEDHYVIERGKGPQVTRDGRFVAALVEPSLEALEKAAAEKDEAKKPKNGLALVATAGGEEVRWQRVDSFAFSDDGRWLAVHHLKDEKPAAGAEQAETPPAAGAEQEETSSAEGAAAGETPPTGTAGEPPAQPAGETTAEPPVEPAVEPASEPPAGAAGEAEKEDEKGGKDERLGATLVLRHLDDGSEIALPYVTAYAFDRGSRYLAYAVAAPGGEGNGLFVRALTDDGSPELEVTAAAGGRYTHLVWAEEASRLGFVAAIDDEDGEPGDGTLWLWDGEARQGRAAATSEAAPEGWFIPSTNDLVWSKDGARLFFGYKPRDEKVKKKDKKTNGDDKPFDPYDLDAILDQRGVDVWHTDDPRIIPNQKKEWEEREKDRTYRAVYHVADDRAVPLADRVMRQVDVADNPRATIAYADVPYLKEITWDGWYRDVYWLPLDGGERRLIAERLRQDEPSLSPDGRFVAYYLEPHWYLYDADAGTSRNLTATLEVSFANEDHDYPQPAPSYGVADWLEDGSAVLIYDKYDVWSFPTGGGEPARLTGGLGRSQETVFRLVDLDPDRDFIRAGETLLLLGYRDKKKNDGFWQATAGEVGVRPLIEEEKRFRVVAKAEEADRLLYTRESYEEFPDLWIADSSLAGRRKLSDANPQIADYAWGKAELVEWLSADGVPLQGVLIKPGNYRPGERYPVLVYFYRFFSQRLHQFNEPVVNHRPSFPLYAGNGYAIFLPDVRFEIGRPGLAAVKCLVPGVQKLIEMGIADPDRIGLHGHSWSGYQTAFVVTQTNLFRAAVAGAPVSNMTSAYGGIRWGSGLARQFQYERSQSRLGVSLWQGRDRYVENSPLFYADRIETPLLLMFGDEDEAVPWYQGIELYLALRRLGKEAVFLQYRGEGHHPKTYANKLDYAIKMKEFFDHHLLDAPAPAWWRDGVPYRGE
ncbi:MAG: S9 family peptidase [Acidobacteria bacterium]|nr:MAG: S9 family peptidase [Acidobacteriota bacterium]